MVIERVEMTVLEGREDEFETMMRTGISLLKGAEGCHAATLARGVEQPSRYLLMLQWRSLENHMAFTKSADFARFRELAAPFYAERPAMQHFAPLIEKH
jgi:heme-degrading monooxygenase HmoA